MDLKNICIVIAILFHCALAYAIEIDKDELNFGKVREGESAALSFKIKNSSLKPLEAGIRPSCDCITAEPSLIKLKAGASQDIIIKVDTEGYSGLFDKQVYVQANDNEKPYSAVRIFGEIEGNTVPQIDNEKTINDVQVKKTARVVIFASPGCGICKKIESETMPEYAKKYGIKVEIRLLSLDDPKNYEKLLEIEKRLGKPLINFLSSMPAAPYLAAKMR